MVKKRYNHIILMQDWSCTDKMIHEVKLITTDKPNRPYIVMHTYTDKERPELCFGHTFYYKGKEVEDAVKHYKLIKENLIR